MVLVQACVSTALAMPQPEPAAAARPGDSDPADATVDESTGAASMEIPIEVPPGPGGLTPRLSLVYASSSGDGSLGVGWSLEGLGEIACSTRFGVPDPAACAHYELDGQLLVGQPGASTYHTFVESFAEIERRPDGSWELRDMDGLRRTYGATSASRIGGGGADVRWLLSRVEDPFHNAIRIEYATEGDVGHLYPRSVHYGPPGTRELRFLYEWRPHDPIRDYRGGVERSVRKRLAEVQVLVNGGVYQRLVLRYERARHTTRRSRLASIQRFGADCPLARDPQTQCRGPAYGEPSGLPPRRFRYRDGGIGADGETLASAWRSDATWNTPEGVRFAALSLVGSEHTQVADINGDGLPDLVSDPPYNAYRGGDAGAEVFLNNGAGWEQPDWSGPNESARWTDALRALSFDMPEIVATQVWSENPAAPGVCAVSVGIARDRVHLSYEQHDPGPGFVMSRGTRHAHASGQAFETRARARGWFRLADIDADGRADLVMSVRVTGLYTSVRCGDGSALPSPSWAAGADARAVFRNNGEPQRGGWTLDEELAEGLPPLGLISIANPEYLWRRIDPAAPPAHEGETCVTHGLGGLRAATASGAYADWDFCFNRLDLRASFVDMNGDGYPDVVTHPPERGDALFPNRTDKAGFRESSFASRVWIQRPRSQAGARWVHAPEFDLPAPHVEIFQADGESKFDPYYATSLPGLPRLRVDDLGLRFADLNRDGLTDLLSAGARAFVYLNRGRGDAGVSGSAWCGSTTPACQHASVYELPEGIRFSMLLSQVVGGSAALETPQVASGVQLADVNGDGWLDLVDASLLYPGSHETWIHQPGGSADCRRGAGMRPCVWSSSPAFATPSMFLAQVPLQGTSGWEGSGVRLFDANGDGAADFVASKPQLVSSGPTKLSAATHADLLVEAENGLGGTLQLAYASAASQRDPRLEQRAEAHAHDPDPAVAEPRLAGGPEAVIWTASAVVASVSVRSAAPNRLLSGPPESVTETTRYRYAQPRFCRDHRSGLGFRLVEKRRPDAARIESFYFQRHGRAGRLSRRTLWEDTRPRHQLEEIWERVSDPLAVTGAGEGVALARIALRRQHHVYGDALGEQPGAVHTRRFRYDDVYGYNFVSEIRQVRPSGVLRIERSPESDRVHGIHGLQRERRVIAEASGTTLRHALFDYRSAGRSTRGKVARHRELARARDATHSRWVETRFAYDAFGNRISITTEGPTAEAGDERVATFCYDGDPGCPRGHGSHSLLAGTRDAAGKWTRLHYDAPFETPTRVESDYADEPSVTRELDPFGRLVDAWVIPANRSRALRTRHVDYVDLGPSTPVPVRSVLDYVDEAGTAAITTVTYGDGFGGIWKTVEAVDASAEGGAPRYKGRARFVVPDARRVRETYDVACADARCDDIDAAAPGVLTERDALGRILRVETPDGFSLSHYEGVPATPASGATLDAVLLKNAKGDLERRSLDGDRPIAILECAAVAARRADLSRAGRRCDGAEETRFDYEADGLVRSITDPRGQIAVAYGYDTLGRVIRADAANAGTSFISYDAEGNVAWTRDARDFVRRRRYDALNRLTDIEVAVPEGAAAEGRVRVSYRWDQRQPQAEQVDGVYVVAFGYDALGRLERETLFNNQAPLRYRYDLQGRVVEIEAPIAFDGVRSTTRYEYEGAYLKRVCDLQGQRSCRDPGVQPYLLDVAYDALGRRSRMRLPGGERRFEYDAATRHLTRDSFRARGAAYEVEYLFRDADGNPLYDELGNLLEIRGTSSIASDPEIGAVFGYDDRNRIAWWQRAGADRVTYAYDARGNLVHHRGVAQGYDPLRPHALATRGDVRFTHDEGGYLSARRGPAGDRHFRFDSDGRLVCVDSRAGSGPELARSACDVLGVVYDSAGRRLKEVSGARERWFGGDHFVHLPSARVAERESRIEIRAFGERIAFKHIYGGALVGVPGGAFRLPTWGGPAGCIAALCISVLAARSGVLLGVERGRGRGLLVIALVVGLGIPRPLVAFWLADETRPGSALYRWVISDRVGSGLILLDRRGARVRHTVFDPFGGVVESVGAGGRRHFAGHPQQEETRLYFMQARWYDSETGRFLSADPVLDASSPQTMNAYSYVANNPVNQRDPTGAFATECDARCSEARERGIPGTRGDSDASEPALDPGAGEAPVRPDEPAVAGGSPQEGAGVDRAREVGRLLADRVDDTLERIDTATGALEQAIEQDLGLIETLQEGIERDTRALENPAEGAMRRAWIGFISRNKNPVRSIDFRAPRLIARILSNQTLIRSARERITTHRILLDALLARREELEASKMQLLEKFQ